MRFVEKIKDRNYRRPSGPLGRMIGNSMARQHEPENFWTVSLLRPGPADRVLEVGFGPGVATERLAELVPEGQVCGVDFSETMVKAARRRNAAAVRDGRVDLRRGDAADLPFEDASFDKAFSVHSVYFWPEPARVLGEVRRVLRPGGLLILTLLPKRRMDGAETTPEFRPYSGEELVGMLEEAGYAGCRVEQDDEPGLRSNYSVLGRKAADGAPDPRDRREDARDGERDGR